MTRLPVTGSVWVGGYALEVGLQTGSFVQFEDEREKDHARVLGEALAEKPEERLTPVDALEELEDTADAVTDRIEHADKLFRAAAEGGLLERDLLTGEIGALLGLLQRLDKKGRFDEELRLARALHGLLVLAFRWLELVRSLRMVLGAARTAGHEGGQAWALNELGALQLCAGDAERAVEHLEEALALEEALGDAAGRCTTRHNLDSARRDLARATSGGRTPRLRRIAVVAGALALFGAGAAFGFVVGDTGGDDGTTEVQTTQRFTLAVEKVGDGAGTVTGANGAIDCGSECSEELEAGRTVTLTAEAGPGSEFGGWDRVGCDGEESCTVTLDGDVTVQAAFGRVPPENAVLSVKFRGGGSGSVSVDGIDCDVDCTKMFEAGSTVTLTAVAGEGSAFVGWEDVATCGEEASCDVTLDGDTTAGARFEPVVTLSVKKAGGGTVTSDPAGIDCGKTCNAGFAKGTEVTLTPVPDDGWAFAGWDKACAGTTGDCIVVMTESTVAVAKFQKAG